MNDWPECPSCGIFLNHAPAAPEGEQWACWGCAFEARQGKPKAPPPSPQGSLFE